MPISKIARSPFWYLDVQVLPLPRVRRSTGTSNRAEAQRIHDEVKAELQAAADAALAGQPDKETKLFSDAALLWCSKDGRSESDILSMRKFALFFSDRPLEAVTREEVDAAIRRITTKPGTYTRYRASILAILNLAADEGWLKNVPRLKTLSGGRKAPERWLTDVEWTRLYEVLPDHLRAPAMFAVLTGMRQSNVFGLTWDRVDLARSLVWVNAIDTKADKPIGVPLSKDAVVVLAGQQGKHSSVVFPYRGRQMAKPRKSWQDACITVGLGVRDPKGHYSGFKWHGLRHTFATWHIQAGTPLHILQKLGAWSDLRMVQNYAHLDPGFIAQFADNIKRP